MILKKYLCEGDQNSTSPCGKRAKERVKFYKSENGGQNSTWLKNKSIFYTRPLKVGVKILHRLEGGGGGGQKGRAYALSQT